MSAILAPNGVSGSANLTVVVKFILDDPRYHGSKNLDSKYAITRFIQEVCATGKGDPRKPLAVWYKNRGQAELWPIFC